MTLRVGGRLRVGTRGSALALAQCTALLAGVRAGGVEVEVVPIVSAGDRTTASLASLGGTGVFVTTLREALLTGEVDAIVHSCKDLPTAPHAGIELAALPRRADARDALVTATGAGLADLPAGAVVGTGSPRRRAQVLRARPDLVVRDIRGNVDTRLRRVLAPRGDDEPLDAVVLAGAGLDRLGRGEVVTERFALDAWPTAPAQGVLAVEIRDDAAADVRDVVGELDDAEARAAATAEREVLRLLEAGCAAPLGVAVVDGRPDRPVGPPGSTRTTAELDPPVLLARVYALDGTAMLDARAPLGPDSARAVVEELLAAGAADLAPLGVGR
ncbi:hydroxymethylbilane synthase [Salana multivorans]|uniref:hydroxymethylbilane synthase n=1 Tax=Salana multivorans TaxID=120377 RepID=UPI000A784B42|nr:hydroxymethylbilane synthase [Salana multivorans]